MRGLATGYEIQVDLVRAISLHRHKIDHVAHLGPSVAAGIGTLLGLPAEIIYQSVQQALHTTTATRQSRKGEISSWKAFAPSHAGKLAIEAVDRAMRGEGAPSPIYEGEDGVVAWMLDGRDAHYRVPLPAPGEPKRGILDTYTKEHSAEYQSQALIDLAFRMGRRVRDWDDVESILIETSHHTHNVIGTGSNDPQKFDPDASRETLDHSIMYIVAVALQDGEWHHVRSYDPQRAQRPDTVALWKKISTVEDPRWTARYHSEDAAVKAFGGRVIITLKNGTVIEDELAVANAHTLGATPWPGRPTSTSSRSSPTASWRAGGRALPRRGAAPADARPRRAAAADGEAAGGAAAGWGEGDLLKARGLRPWTRWGRRPRTPLSSRWVPKAGLAGQGSALA